MAEKFDPAHWQHLENPERLNELPPVAVIDLLSLAGAGTIVDFGAGTGMYTIPIAEALPHGVVLAVDELPELLGRLQEKLELLENRALRERVKIVQSDQGRVPLADGTADRVLAINVLHHIHDDPLALGEITRLLAPGGRLVVIEFGAIERPVGPPIDHVLPHDRLRTLVAGMGLAEAGYHEPGELLPYHVVVVAEKP